MALSELDDLLGIAEIATVFVGFAVLISVVSPRSSDKQPIVAMIMGASMVLVACIMPILVRTFQIDAIAVVRISSFVFVIANAMVVVAMLKLIPGFSELTATRTPIVAWSMEAVMYTLLVLCAAGIWPKYSVSLYYGAVVVLLVQVIVLFMVLAISLSQDE